MIYSKIINESKQSHGASINIKSKARELRKNMTKTEVVLWNYLRKKQQSGMYFRRQHPFGIYILDFYCFEADLVIEIDGEVHLGRMQYDKERTSYLESTGLKVLRFKNDDIEKRIDWVIEEINRFLKNENHHPGLPPRGKEKKEEKKK